MCGQSLWCRFRYVEILDTQNSHISHSVFFIFVFFKKKITEIYFCIQVLQFYTPAARQGGGRGPTARQVGGRDLYVNKNKFFLRRGPWREPAAPLPSGRGAAGSLLKYKTPTLPSAPSFSAHEIQRGERERGGVREVKKPAKPYRILDPNRR